MDKSIDQRAEEKYSNNGIILPEDRFSIEGFIEGYKACQQNLEVSERFAKLIDEERMEILSDYCTYCGQNEKELGKCYCAPHYDD